jgi:hypothetical protein
MKIKKESRQSGRCFFADPESMFFNDLLDTGSSPV